ncbi:MAG: T9SS type A sorting domain-containing protein [Bacteroidales bacterium]|nr:T9SS type A sorting domain-containing protein [Bacteroidales bacterium]
MKKSMFLFLLSALLAQGFAVAQGNMMTVPYGSFEQWTSHPGYSVTAIILPISVYSSFSTPTGWDYLTYPVNESVSVMGANININTNLPLIKASQETASVPSGSSAVKLQTFMLSDIVSSTVYSMAASNIDTMLTNMVFPSILSTGTLDIDHFIPLMTSMMDNMDSAEALLSTLAGLDISYYITGGIPMNDFVPSRLTGWYKYHSAISGDNGGVVLLGTRYNSTLGRREVVGGGANIDLTDTGSYTPFTVGYMSLHDLDASYPLQTPDSLVVLLVSSASLDRQQGSWLCVDSLELWHDPCAGIAGISAVPDIHEAVVAWGATGSVNGYELEYGPAGFTLGTGTLFATLDNSYTLVGLDANTQYDVYLRTICNNGIRGDWESYTFATQQDTCATITAISVDPDIHEAYVAWSSTSAVDGFEVIYCPSGVNPGDGEWLSLATEGCTLTGLEANTLYDLYVRSVCGYIYGAWAGMQFHTLADTCAHIIDLTVVPGIHDATVSWSATGPVETYELEYGVDDYTQPYFDPVRLTDNSYTISGLDAEYPYWVTVRAICGDSLLGELAIAHFFTLADTTPTQSIIRTVGQAVSVYPNPAHGSVTVEVGEPSTVTILDLVGREVVPPTVTADRATFPLPSGVFLLQAVTPSGTAIHKIVSR